MTVEDARNEYRVAAYWLATLIRDGHADAYLDRAALWSDAASIVLDLAVSEDVARRSIAWA